MDYPPLTSIIIPCYNEVNFLAACLESIIESNYPKESLEVLVIDGLSTDGTREVIKKYSEEYPFIMMMDNPQRIVPTALNIGIQNSKGMIILRMDAHSIYDKDYISKCVESMEKYDADNVGGVWHTLPGADTIMAKSIALALAHPFGVGNAYYRIGSKEPRSVDTVPFGCYRREVFDQVGFFDEDLVRNQDDEMNHRIIKNGGKIMLIPGIISHYFARDRLSKLGKMMFQYGYFKPLVAKKIGGPITWRQLIPPLFVASLVVSLLLSLLLKSFRWPFIMIVSLYVIVNLYYSISLSLKNGKTLLWLPAVFTVNHISYGAGYLKGIWDFIIRGKYNIKMVRKVPITR